MSKYYIPYRLTLEEPVIISDGTQTGNILQTRDYIPGSTISGLVAACYLQHQSARQSSGEMNPEFQELLFSEQTVFSNAYPCVETKNREILETFPMPLSVFGCKYQGDRQAPNDEDSHGFADYIKRPIPDACPAPNCAAPLEHKTGFAYLVDPAGPYCNHMVQTEIIAHNRVGRKRDNRDLFAYAAMRRGQKFDGEIAVSNPKLKEKILDLLQPGRRYKIGKSKNRGYGCITFDFVGHEKGDKTVRNQWRNQSEVSDGEFVLYLFSDAIVVNSALQYQSCLDKNSLALYAGGEPNDWTVQSNGLADENEKSGIFSRIDTVMGFNQKRGMPLPMEQVIAKGSVFTVAYNGAEELEPKLKHLMENGIGLRRNEGFGQVIVNHHIHHAGGLS